jgi:hypothetical protein
MSGLVSKYEVLRYGQPVETCFVLRYDRDKHALAALAAYAASVRSVNEELSDDLWRLVKIHTGQLFAPQEELPSSVDPRLHKGFPTDDEGLTSSELASKRVSQEQETTAERVKEAADLLRQRRARAQEQETP